MICKNTTWLINSDVYSFKIRKTLAFVYSIYSRSGMPRLQSSLSVSQDLSKRIQLCKYAFRTPILYCRNRMNKMELRKNEMASLTFICSNSYFEDALGVVCRLRYNIFVAHIIRLQIYVSFYLISDTVIRSIFNILWNIQVFIWLRELRGISLIIFNL